jgi:hypothetical protein
MQFTANITKSRANGRFFMLNAGALKLLAVGPVRIFTNPTGSNSISGTVSRIKGQNQGRLQCADLYNGNAKSQLPLPLRNGDALDYEITPNRDIRLLHVQHMRSGMNQKTRQFAQQKTHSASDQPTPNHPPGDLSFCDLLALLGKNGKAPCGSFQKFYDSLANVFKQRNRIISCSGVDRKWPKASGVYCIWRNKTRDDAGRELLYVGIAGKIKRHDNLVGIANAQKQFPQREARWTPYLFDRSSSPGYYWWGPKHSMPRHPKRNFNTHYKKKVLLNEIEIDCFICTGNCLSPRAIESLILQAFYEYCADLPPANNEL